MRGTSRARLCRGAWRRRRRRRGGGGERGERAGSISLFGGPARRGRPGGEESGGARPGRPGAALAEGAPGSRSRRAAGTRPAAPAPPWASPAAFPSRHSLSALRRTAAGPARARRQRRMPGGRGGKSGEGRARGSRRCGSRVAPGGVGPRAGHAPAGGKGRSRSAAVRCARGPRPQRRCRGSARGAAGLGGARRGGGRARGLNLGGIFKKRLSGECRFALGGPGVRADVFAWGGCGALARVCG